MVPGLASAGVEDWRVNEVVPSAAGTSDFRFVELYAPPSDFADSCLFPTSRVEVYDADGTFLGAAAPVATTRCYGGDTYFLLAPAEAAEHYGVARDAALNVLLPAAGQLCFASSTTRYDCVRWGTIVAPVADLYDPEDATSAPGIPDGVALARRSDTGVVADDFFLTGPTPRQPNDGSVWLPPDAGPLPDAAGPPDGGPLPDAPDLPDAPPRTHPDARAEDPAWFLADPGGGAVCTCRVGVPRGGDRGGGAAALVPLAVLLRKRRRMR